MDNMNRFDKFGFNSEKELNNVFQAIGLNITEKYEFRSDSLTGKLNFILRSSEGREVNLELKKLYDLRYSNFLPHLLESYCYSRNLIDRTDDFLLIVKTKKASKAIFAKASKYLEEFNANDLNWIVVDDFGKIFGRYNNSEIYTEISVFEDSTYKNKILTSVKESSGVTYSAIQQWLLKCLLLNGINHNKFGSAKSLWPLDFDKNLANYKRLSEVSGVSESSCFSFLKLLEESSYLERNNFGYKFKHIKKILDGWFHAYSNEKKDVLFLSPVKPLYDEQSWAKEAISRFNCYSESYNSKIILSGHLGTQASSLSFSNNNSSIFYTPSLSTNDFDLFMKNMKLTPSGDKSSSIRAIVQKNKYPIIELKKIYQGSSQDNRGIIADPIQLFLDVQYLGGRGKEQADYIYEKLLSKHFKDKKWLS